IASSQVPLAQAPLSQPSSTLHAAPTGACAAQTGIAALLSQKLVSQSALLWHAAPALSLGAQLWLSQRLLAQSTSLEHAAPSASLAWQWAVIAIGPSGTQRS